MLLVSGKSTDINNLYVQKSHINLITLAPGANVSKFKSVNTDFSNTHILFIYI
jgi:hypothetical protein